MSRSRTIVISGLNVSMHNPHSPQRYVDLLVAAYRRREVLGQGELHALLLGALYGWGDGVENNLVSGEIYRFVQIDVNEPWFNSRTRKRASQDEVSQIRIPRHLLAHMQRIPFIFFPKEHRLFLISQDGKARLSIASAAHYFQRLFDGTADEDVFPPVEVTPIPDYDSLDNMLALPRIDKLVMRFKRPNADDGEEYEARFLKQMEARNVQSIVEEYTAADTQGIMTDDQIRMDAEVAARNGLVSVAGRDASGQKVSESTKEKPMKIFEPVDSAVETANDVLHRSALGVLARVLKRRRQTQ